MSNQITPNPSAPSQVVAEVTFPRWINNLGIIPTSYKDSMSYYECLAWLCKFLEETVIPSVNENGEAVEELQNLYIELNSYVAHYFETLDVQEEINNKLDDMVEDGTLPEIVASYLQTKAVFGFDTVAGMKDGTNLINGSYARTLGFYAKNDGGSALYKIRTITNDDVVNEMNIIALNNNNSLIAELIIPDIINVKQLGAKGDNTTDDLSKLQAINDLYENKTIFIPDGTYLISNTLYISNNNSLLMDNNATLKASQNMNYMLIYNKENITSTYDKTFKKFIKGGTLDGDYKVNESILSLQGILGFTVSDMKILNFNKYGIKTKTDDGNVNEAIFDNIYIRNDQPVLNTVGIYNNANDCKFSNIIIRDVHKGIETITGYFDYIHGWIGMPTLIPGSFFMRTKNNEVIANNCYADTYQYSFISTFGSLNITNAFILCNNNVYTSAIQTDNKPYLFYSEADEFSLGTYGYFKVINSQIDTSKFEEVYLVNRNNANNEFTNNYYTNYNKILNKNYIQDKQYKGAFSGSADTLFENGAYSVSNSNTGIPGSYSYGQIIVHTSTTTGGAYIKNNDNTYLSYCSQLFISFETIPKFYMRTYTKSNGWSAWEKITTTTQT